MKSVYSFTSTSDYLQQYFENSKKGNPNFNLKKYSKNLDIGLSSLKMILTNKRRMTTHQALSAARALKFSPDETEYYETLCLRDLAKTTWERTHYMRLLSERKKQRRIQTLPTSEKLLLTDHLALPLLVYLSENKTILSKLENKKLTLIWLKSLEVQFQK